jgi:hypothetical protein
MAYELGLLCVVPEGESPEALVRQLLSSLEPAPTLDSWRYGETWAACEVGLSPAAEPVIVQANVADNVVANIALRGASEGVLADPLGFQAVVTMTLTGDVDWLPIRALILAAKERWNGILFDEVSGFNATIE